MAEKPVKGAIFIDRDGTVSEEVGYMYHADLYRPFSWTGEAIRKINESGMKAILITNQSGIARGYFKESTVHEVHGILRREIARFHAHLDGIYFCPHRPEDGCDCRKPKPGMLLRAIGELDLLASASKLIGDKASDLAAGASAGVGECRYFPGMALGDADDPIERP